MSNQSDHTIVRLRVPPELKKQIEDAAEENNRSQSAEMVARLEESFKVKQGNYLNNDAVNDLLEAFTKKIFTALKSQGASRELMESTVNELKNKKAP
ncbi:MULTISPECIES: Arc family DNA-binding protein [unclassified Acinetobacter]|jgi:phosphoenolpyruvate synthase/pyruvate phosphate dikinase|uniref:Arc family DNA-binding protein n=1 Tax=unclassified Acinetobacter TaxID=196816 RepID=UPI0015D2AAB6|nr:MULTISPECIES: Arc family DNA-binding protein [unclassified Acinetobacter]